MGSLTAAHPTPADAELRPASTNLSNGKSLVVARQ